MLYLSIFCRPSYITHQKLLVYIYFIVFSYIDTYRCFFSTLPGPSPINLPYSTLTFPSSNAYGPHNSITSGSAFLSSFRPVYRGEFCFIHRSIDFITKIFLISSFTLCLLIIYYYHF